MPENLSEKPLTDPTNREGFERGESVSFGYFVLADYDIGYLGYHDVLMCDSPVSQASGHIVSWNPYHLEAMIQVESRNFHTSNNPSGCYAIPLSMINGDKARRIRDAVRAETKWMMDRTKAEKDNAES